MWLEGLLAFETLVALDTDCQMLVANQLRRCPGCGHAFERHRRQLYCSKRCLNRVTVQRWRARQQETTCGNKAEDEDRQESGRGVP